MVVKNRTGLCKRGRSIWSMPSSDWMKSPVTEENLFYLVHSNVNAINKGLQRHMQNVV